MMRRDPINTLTGDMTRLLTCSTMGRWTESVLVTRVTLLPVHLSAWYMTIVIVIVVIVIVRLRMVKNINFF